MCPTTLPDGIACLTLPAPTIGTVNAWLLMDDPITLIDVGPAGGGVLPALEAGLAAHGVRLADVEQVLLTHHHADHCGLTATLAARGGVTVHAIEALAAYGRSFGARNAESARYTARLLARHGVPGRLVTESAAYWQLLDEHGESFACDHVLRDGDVVAAGGRELRVLHRPGHCSTDTLFVDEAAGLAFVGDHVLARVSSGCEIEPPADGEPRPRALATYLDNLRATAALGLGVGLGGHGPPVQSPAGVIARRLELHERRMVRLTELLAGGPQSAFELGCGLFGDQTARVETVLVTWDVLGHLDVLAERGAVQEHVDGEVTSRFAAV